MNSTSSRHPSADASFELVHASFVDGPLGVTLRRLDSGTVLISAIDPSQQAVSRNLDCRLGDVLWSLRGADASEDIVIGDAPLSKEVWDDHIRYVKSAPRPLEVTWKRYSSNSIISASNAGSMSDAGPHQASNNNNVNKSEGNNDNNNRSIVNECESIERLRSPSTDSRRSLTHSCDSTTSAGTEASNLSAHAGSACQESCGLVGSHDNVLSDGHSGTRHHSGSSAGTGSNQHSRNDLSAIAAHIEDQGDSLILRELSKHLYIKEKSKPAPSGIISGISGYLSGWVSGAADHSSNAAVSEPKHFDVNKQGRRFVRTGEMSIVAVNSTNFSSAAPTIHVIYLFSDMLLITTPFQAPNSAHDTSFLIEERIDLQILKVRTSVFSSKFISEEVEQSNTVNIGHEGTDFELIWPQGHIQLRTRNESDKGAWITDLSCTMRNVYSSLGLGYKHQYVLGTMHSAVITNDESLALEIIRRCNNDECDFSAIECQDEDGATPLHYAVLLKNYSMMQLLHSASANVHIQDLKGSSPIHWAALQLDHRALKILTEHVFDIDGEDFEGRTPLYLACVAGRNPVTKLLDEAYLCKCISILVDLEADINIATCNKSRQTIVHHLASTWQVEALDLIVNPQNYSVKKKGADLYVIDQELGFNALLYAVRGIPIHCPSDSDFLSTMTLFDSGKNIVSTGGDVNLLNNNVEAGLKTVHFLLDHGMCPNFQSVGSRRKSSIDLVADTGDAVWGDRLVDVAALLVRYGCRLDSSSPRAEWLKNRCLEKAKGSEQNSLPGGGSFNLTVLSEERHVIAIVDAAKCGLSSLEAVQDIIARNGDRYRIYYPENQSGSPIQSGSPDKSTLNASLPSPPTSPSALPPGSICWLCGVAFTLFRRQHHCRLCNALCCDDCSRKRCQIEGQSELRSCDPCYNRLLFEIERKRREKEKVSVTDKFKKIVAVTASSTNGKTADRVITVSADREAQGKNNLFKGAMVVSDANGSKSASAANSTNATINVLSETQERLKERGERLSQVNDKSAQMASQASQFSKLAKQLRQQQESSWF